MANEKENKEKKQETPKGAPTHGSDIPELLTEEENESGAIRISENVIAAVVRKYVLEVSGVVRFASGSIVGGIAEMIGRKNYESSVLVDLDGDAVNISVTLILEFGVKIPEIAALVQDVIRSRVEELTGKHVTKVDVIVQNLEDTTEKEQEPEPKQA